MLRLVLRPLLVILTLGILLVALFQVSGRIAMVLLDDLEAPANRFLAERGVQLEGLSGDWRMLNPVIRVDRITFPAGAVDGVVLEVDMVESVLRGTPLARRLKVSDARVELVKDPGEPWRLRGAGPAAEFDLDLDSFLRHSNQLELDGVVHLSRAGSEPADLRVAYLGVNRGGEHRHRFTLSNSNSDCAADGCSLQLVYHGQERLWPLREQRDRVSVLGEGFLLPRAVLGFSPLEVARLDASWQRERDLSGGRMALRTEQFDMPGDVTLAMELHGTVRGSGATHRGVVQDWRVEQGDEVWELPGLSVNADGRHLSAWMPELDLERVAGFLKQALAAVEPAERWLAALDLRGRAENLRAAFSLEGGGLAYAMTLSDVALQGFKGVPTVAGAGGDLFGFGRGLQLNLNANDMHIAFPDVFTGSWVLPYAQGALQVWFSPRYFGARGLNLRGETLGARAVGSFAMSRPPDREGQRLLLNLSTDRIDVAAVQQFVPYKLPEDLKQWLETAPRGGVLEDARLVYQGQFQEEPGELARRLALSTRLRDAQVRYHPDWPLVTDLGGRLDVSGSLVSLDASRGLSAGARVDGSRVRVLDNGSTVDVSLDADVAGGDALGFVRTTPLAQWLSFVESDWQAAGRLRLSGEITVPLGSEAREPAVRLRADLHAVDFSMPGYRLDLAALSGSVRYRYPHFVDASGVTGELFGEPVTLGARTDTDGEGDRVHLRIAGTARPGDAWALAGVADPGVASGTFAYDADLSFPVAPGGTTELTASSDLTGTAVDLPAGYGKAADVAVPGEVRLTFRPDYQALRFRYRDADGWLHFDDALRRGAVAFAGLPEAENEGAGNLVLSGRLAGFELDEILPDAPAASGSDDGTTLPLPIRLESLQVDRIGIGDFTVDDATLEGEVGDNGFAIRVNSEQVAGFLRRRGTEPVTLDLVDVRMPAGDGDGQGDPLDPTVIAELPDADVTIGKLRVGDADYGSWGFSLRPRDGRLQVEGLTANVRGMTLSTSEPLVWDGAAEETRFTGTLDAGNLADVLRQWGYAPSVETESAALTGSFAWHGSPLAVDLLALRGEARAEASSGRFLEVESGAGAQRIFSLLNFTAIAKRMTLNFGDVFGRGISFDELTADFSLDEGRLTFDDPMVVEGTGSRFRVTGTVDLEERRLDNEMIVTLPVSQSLPWYAAYVALANPLAGLGVLVGERVFRKPIEQFSSARYHIGGTLDEPDVKFMSVFDVTPTETAADDDAQSSVEDGATTSPDIGDAGTTAQEQESDDP